MFLSPGVWGTQETVIGGNDLDMPGNGFGGILGNFMGPRLEALVANGTVDEARLDDMVHRILTPFYALGQADKALPSVPFNAGFTPQNVTYRLVQKASTVDLVRRIAEDGAVLLKNDGALPLKAPPRIAIIGNDAGPPARGCGATGDACPAGSNWNGTLSDAGGSGYAEPLNLIDPLAAIQQRAAKDLSKVTWVLNDTDIVNAQATAARADVALVFANAWAAEVYDRPSLNLTGGGNALIEAVAAVNNNTIVRGIDHATPFHFHIFTLMYIHTGRHAYPRPYLG
jgi:beta-glucosidase